MFHSEQDVDSPNLKSNCDQIRIRIYNILSNYISNSYFKSFKTIISKILIKIELYSINFAQRVGEL